MPTHSIAVTGTLLATLLHELSEKDEDTEALLFGMEQQTTVRNATDESDESMSTTTVIAIHDFAILPGTFLFYDGAGRVDIERLKGLVGMRSSEFVGWLRFRRNTPTQPSLREAAVMEGLGPLCRASVGPILVVVSHTRREDSTHTFDYALVWTLKDNKTTTLQRAHLDIANLVQSTQTEYFFSSAMPSHALENSAELMSVLKKSRTQETLQQLERGRDWIVALMQTKVATLSEKEAHLQALRSQVLSLERQLGPAGRPAVRSRPFEQDAMLIDVDAE